MIRVRYNSFMIWIEMLGQRPVWLVCDDYNDILVSAVCDAGCPADAGHRAEGQGNYCAHRIEARVARSRGDSAEIFKKFDESVYL